MMEHRRPKGTALLLLGLLVAHVAVLSSRAGYEPDDVEVSFNLDHQPMEEVLQRLREILKDNRPRLTVAGHSYLAPKVAEPGSPPGRWIKVHLAAGDHRTTLAFGDGDIYLLAFANITRHWNCFPGFETLFPGGTRLPFEENYQSLAWGYKNLVNFPLGKDAAKRAVKTLSGYNPSTTPANDAKQAVVSFLLMISEALRFKPIQEVFTGQHWGTETFLTEYHTKLIMRWGQISYCLWLWEKAGAWPSTNNDAKGLPDKVQIRNAADALSVLDLLKRPRAISIDSEIY